MHTSTRGGRTVCVCGYVCVSVYCFAFFLSKKTCETFRCLQNCFRKKETPHTRTHTRRWMQHTQTYSIHKEILRKLINRFRVHQRFLIDGVGNTLLSFQLTNGRMNGFKWNNAFYFILLWLSHSARIKCIIMHLTTPPRRRIWKKTHLQLTCMCNIYFIFFKFILTFIFVRICSSTTRINHLLFFPFSSGNQCFYFILFSYCKGMSVAIYPFFSFCESSSLQRM